MKVSGSREEVTQCIYHICCALLESPPKGEPRLYRPDGGGFGGDSRGFGGGGGSSRGRERDRFIYYSRYTIIYLLFFSTVTGESAVRLDLVVNTATHLRPLLTLPGGSAGVEAGVEMTAGTENRG